MLTHIDRIKNLGVFDDYTAHAELPAFSRYNVVYGENGSGKTTLSRLLAALEAGSHGDYPGLEFAIRSQSGQLTQGSKYSRKVRVFNSDYVEANLGRLDGPLRHILILGEENKLLGEQLKKEIATKDAREVRIAGLESAAAKHSSDQGKVFSQIAKTIGEATSGATLRSYRKPNAEATFAALEKRVLLHDDELNAFRNTIQQQEMSVVPMIASSSSVWDLPSALEAATACADQMDVLLSRTAQSAAIERLIANPPLAIWVEDGLHLHIKEKSANCEFCARPMPAERLKALSEHFSTEDQQVKEDVESQLLKVKALAQVFDGVTLPDQLALYSELRPDFAKASEQFQSERESLQRRLGTIEQLLTEKLIKRTSAYSVSDSDSDADALSKAIDELSTIITRHNDKCQRFDQERRSAQKAVESHYLRSIKEQVEEYGAKIAEIELEVELLKNGGEGLDDPRSLQKLEESIAEKRAKVSSEHTGGELLTTHLKQFLGRTDLRLDAGADGYRVLRRGKPAKRLSEGERTAIAFLYFLTHIKDQDFDMAEGVVVIDDPISSLDASAMYQAFSFLKVETKEAKQLFLLTHNFEFLRLLVNWLKNGPKSEKSYSMVLCSETENGRSARLVPLDKLLIEHATEYHYLFKVLYNFKSDGTILGCYHVPNIARKVLETFLDFYQPSNKKLYQKLADVTFDEHKKTSIYKFTNDLSHHTGKSFDPALVAESQKNAKFLLEMIETVAPLHFAGLKCLCTT